MDALAVILIGVGGYLMYAAYKGEHPWALLQSDILPALGAKSSTTTTSTTGTVTTLPGTTGAPPTHIQQPA